MAKLDQKMIKYLSELSRIHLSEGDQQSLFQDLSKILDYVEELQEINTENVRPCNHVLEDMKNVMREDKTGDTIPREVFLNNAPSTVGGLIRVPPVLKGNNA